MSTIIGVRFKPNDLGRMVEEFEEARIKLEVIDSQMQDILQITLPFWTYPITMRKRNW